MIGRGGSGTVHQALDLTTGEVVAIKTLHLNGHHWEGGEGRGGGNGGLHPNHHQGREEVAAGVQMEVDLLKKLVHPNIVNYIDSIRTEDTLHIVLEYMENGSLRSLCDKFDGFSESLVAIYVTQVLYGLRYLHEQGVLHRDIKGANILTTKDGSVKLADFGVAVNLTDVDDYTSGGGKEGSRQGGGGRDHVVGTPYWMAPEIIEMQCPTAACDIWSLGCTVVELLTGKPPYMDLDPMAALFRIVQDEHPPLPQGISEELQDFLLLCFKKDPALRCSAADLLLHPWLRNPQSHIKRTSYLLRESEALHEGEGWDSVVETLKLYARDSNIEVQMAGTGGQGRSPSHAAASASAAAEEDMNSGGTGARTEWGASQATEAADALGAITSRSSFSLDGGSGEASFGGGAFKVLRNLSRGFSMSMTSSSAATPATVSATSPNLVHYPIGTPPFPKLLTNVPTGSNSSIDAEASLTVLERAASSSREEYQYGGGAGGGSSIFPTVSERDDSKSENEMQQLHSISSEGGFYEDDSDHVTAVASDELPASLLSHAAAGGVPQLTLPPASSSSSSIAPLPQVVVPIASSVVSAHTRLRARTGSSPDSSIFLRPLHESEISQKEDGASALKQAQHHSSSQQQHPPDHGDHVSGCEDGDARKNELLVQRMKLSDEILSLVSSLQPGCDESTIVKSCMQMLKIFKEHPDSPHHFVMHHGVIPIMELLEVSKLKSESIMDRIAVPGVRALPAVLQVVNKIMEDNQSVQEHLSLVGMIPVMIKIADGIYASSSARIASKAGNLHLEASKFVDQVCKTSQLTLQMFISGGGLPLLVKHLTLASDMRRSVDVRKIVGVGISGIVKVFSLQSIRRNDFCHLFVKLGLLPHLVVGFRNFLGVLLEEVDGDGGGGEEAKETSWAYLEELGEIISVFAHSDPRVRERMAFENVCLGIINPLISLYLSSSQRDQSVHTHHTKLMVVLLKCVRALAVEPKTLKILDREQAIVTLMPLLEMQHEHDIEIQDEALQCMFALCKIDKARQELAARHGIIPHLQRCISEQRHTKQYAFTLMCDMAYTSDSAREELWRNDGVDFYLSVIKNPRWRISALNALTVWLANNAERVEVVLTQPKNAEILVRAFIEWRDEGGDSVGNSREFEQLCEAFLRLCVKSTRLALLLGRDKIFIAHLVGSLDSSSAIARMCLLKMLGRIVTNRVTFMEHGVFPILQKLADDQSQVLISEVSKTLLRRIALSYSPMKKQRP